MLRYNIGLRRAQVVDLLPESLRGEADKVDKGTDTMDVWFDSGSSWAGVSQQRDGLRYPADLYLEGSDQHRCALKLCYRTRKSGNAPVSAEKCRALCCRLQGFAQAPLYFVLPIHASAVRSADAQIDFTHRVVQGLVPELVVDSSGHQRRRALPCGAHARLRA